MPRGLTAVRALREAGVVVAAGGDNLQDPFNPMGRADPFETAALMVMTAHLSPADAWRTVTDEARRAVGSDPTAVAPGAPADLLAVRAGSLREAIAFGPPDRMVWHRGRRRSCI
jgi:cytosine deaminase